MNVPIIAYRANMGVQTTAPFLNTYSTSFDGMDDYIDCGVPSNINSLPNLSISCWFKTTTTTNSFIIGSDSVSLGRRFLLQALSSSGMKVRFLYFITPSTFGTIQSTSNINDGNWHHVLAVNNGTNMFLYLDGILESSNTDGGVIQTAVNTPLNIGRRDYLGSYGNFAGNVDEVAIWGTDQSANIATLSTAPTVDLTSLNPIVWLRNGDNGAWKSPQWLIPNNENFAANKVSNYSTQFDGIDDYLNIANNTTIGRTQNISYSIWVNLDVTSRQYIIGNTSSSNGGCGLQIESGDVLVFQMGDGGNDSFFNSRVANFSTYAPINTWNHILATWDGTDSKIYINGVLRNTWSPTLPYTIISYNAFTIGWRSAGFQYMTNGRLDELALFNSAILIGDVWDGSGQPIDVSAVSGITNYWNMGDNSTFLTNWTVPDEVGSNDGTSANMTIEDRIGEAPNSTNNALSFNMDEVDVVLDTPPTP